MLTGKDSKAVLAASVLARSRALRVGKGQAGCVVREDGCDEVPVVGDLAHALGN